ncbi:MAG TPA: acyl-CoA dehydrogenase [Delftia acidovorans]|nr:acyl-CoA dehydrogenase [Delftia acidovorans]
MSVLDSLALTRIPAEDEALRAEVRAFLAQAISGLPPHVRARSWGGYSAELSRQLGEKGWIGVTLPREYGGGGRSAFTRYVLVEEYLACGAPVGSHWIADRQSGPLILKYGTEAQKRFYLPRICRGEAFFCIGMSEPGAGSDLQGVRTRAELRDGRYRINGSKTFITNGLLAGLILVVCKTDPAQGARGTSILIVETRDCAGFRVGRVLDKMGMKAQDTSELFFDDVTVPQDALLGGREGQGFYQLMGDLPYERLIIGLAALACMEGAYEATLAYVRERRAFGQAIADMQNTRFKLAEVATTLTVGRAFIDRCVEQLVAGTLDTATASMAKLWGSEAQGRVLDELVQLHGGYGYMNEYMVTRMYADARVQRIYGGTSEIMKEVISRVL